MAGNAIKQLDYSLAMSVPSVEILPPDQSERDERGRWRPGHGPSSPGRAPGQGVGFTKMMRDAIQQSFAEVGGVDYLVMLAYWKPEVYATLIGRALPLKVVGEDEGIPVINQVTRRVLPKR